MLERRMVDTSFGPMSVLFRRGEEYVVFLHGMGGSGNNWMKVAGMLPPEYGLVLPDLLGHGRSSKPDITYEISEQCSALQQLLSSLSVEKFSLLGHSYGGWISLRFQLIYGGTRKVVLVSSAGTNPTVVERGRLFDQFLDRVMNAGPMNSREIIRKILINNGRPEEKVTANDLKNIPGSYLIIWGTEDRMIPLEYGRALNEMIPGSRFEAIASAGHMPHVSNPGEVSRIISSFLESE